MEDNNCFFPGQQSTVYPTAPLRPPVPWGHGLLDLRILISTTTILPPGLVSLTLPIGARSAGAKPRNSSSEAASASTSIELKKSWGFSSLAHTVFYYLIWRLRRRRQSQLRQSLRRHCWRTRGLQSLPFTPAPKEQPSISRSFSRWISTLQSELYRSVCHELQLEYPARTSRRNDPAGRLRGSPGTAPGAGL